MPIYEYACEQCHQKEDVMQKYNEDPPALCSHCHAEGTLKKRVTAGSFHLKGGGWYKDLYSSPKPEGASGTTKTPAEPEKPAAPAKPEKKEE